MKYDCSKCNQSFSRKWNAERHNELKHDDLSIIYDKKIKPTSNSNSNSKLKTKNPIYKNKFIQFQSNHTLIKNDIFDELFSEYIKLEPDENELKTMKIFGQLYQPFEELEKLLDIFDESSKASILSQVFKSCLKSFRPVKSMKDTIEIYRAIKAIDKISYYYSKSHDKTIHEAKNLVKALVQKSDYFKNNIN
jgi:hypothetical protein